MKVLHDYGEMELVTRSRQASERQPLEAVVGLQVRERMSTRFLSSRDLRKALVVILRRATSRAFS